MRILFRQTRVSHPVAVGLKVTVIDRSRPQMAISMALLDIITLAAGIFTS
jgi:hypothetical protein